jgi:hypothetical protein
LRDNWKPLAIFAAAMGLVAYALLKRRKDRGRMQSVSMLADEEQKNVDRHLALLADTYDLTTLLEALYDILPKQCRFPLDVATNDAGHAAGINAHLMLICRRELTAGILSLLRGYRIDFLFHVRKAIEFCAFAAKMARHPEKSRTWIVAASSDKAWEEFRDQFRKLFPEDDQELKSLSPAFDEASKAMHGSIQAVAHYLSGQNRIDAIPTIAAFDISSDAVLVAYFIRAIDIHLTILTLFGRILTPYAPGIAVWSKQLHDAKVAFTAKHVQWTPFVSQIANSQQPG